MKSLYKFYLPILFVFLSFMTNAMDRKSVSAEDCFNEKSHALFGAHFDYDYGLRRGEHELHAVAMGIGHGFYHDTSNDEFKEFVQRFAEKYQIQFKSQFVCKNIHYSPLGSIYGPDCTTDELWSDEQIEQAKTLFHIYRMYEPEVPEAKVGNAKYVVYSISLLHAILGQSTCNRTQYFVNYYKDLFEQKVEACDDEEFLKYAYVFFQMKDPENPAIQKIGPRKVEATEWFKTLAEARVEDPYEILQNILNKDDKWCLCMDFRQQRAGKSWKEYDAKEPGTISSLIDGFRYILEHREDISYDYVNTLWKIVSQHRKDDIDQRGYRFGCHFPETTLNFMLSFKEMYGDVATLEYTAFDDLTFIPFIFMEATPIIPSLREFNVTAQKIEEMYKVCQQLVNCPPRLQELAQSSYPMVKQKQLEIDNWTKEQVVEFINQFNTTNRDPGKTFEQRVLAAIDFARALEITHEHLDCNARTNIVLVLCKLLMDLKLLPPVFEHPMSFDGKTAVESLPLVIEAIENHRVCFG